MCWPNLVFFRNRAALTTDITTTTDILRHRYKYSRTSLFLSSACLRSFSSINWDNMADRAIRWSQTTFWGNKQNSCLHLTLRKIAIWMSKNCQKLYFFFIDKNCHFFQQNCQWQFCWKNPQVKNLIQAD